MIVSSSSYMFIILHLWFIIWKYSVLFIQHAFENLHLISPILCKKDYLFAILVDQSECPGLLDGNDVKNCRNLFS